MYQAETLNSLFFLQNLRNIYIIWNTFPDNDVTVAQRVKMRKSEKRRIQTSSENLVLLVNKIWYYQIVNISLPLLASSCFWFHKLLSLGFGYLFSQPPHIAVHRSSHGETVLTKLSRICKKNSHIITFLSINLYNLI